MRRFMLMIWALAWVAAIPACSSGGEDFECQSAADCEDWQYCDTGSHTCKERCVPESCADLDLECGDWPDGCGGEVHCGGCPTGQECNADGQCEAVCVPDCEGRCCGSDNCGGICPDRCAETGQECNLGTCLCEGVCQPRSCADLGRACGDWPDGCGGTVHCGGCPTGQECNADGQCEAVCVPDCDGRCCGSDACGGICPDDCGETGQVCNTGTCLCEGACDPESCDDLGKDCGDWPDGCGGTAHCGGCPTGQECNAQGQCEDICEPDCDGRCCGADGCGGTCPDLCGQSGQVCNTGTCTCEEPCTPLTCAELGRECGDWPDGCDGTAHCGNCPTGQECTPTGMCQDVCVPTSCQDEGVECGPLSDGCGRVLNCGSCGTGQICSMGQCVTGVPVLSLLSQNGGTFTLRWTFNWPGLVSTNDHHQLQESTTSPTSGFETILETTWNDHHMPWDETLTRSSGTYHYRVRTYSTTAWTSWSNVVTVNVSVQPATLRIVNDLYAQSSGGNDWGTWNQLYRVYIAGDATSLGNCSDTCDRLEPGNCSLPGTVIQPGGHQRDFDVSMYTDGSYCVFIQCGWWEYFCTEYGCCYDEHAAQVVACDGTCCSYKYAAFCVNDHYNGLFTTYASEWLPQQTYYGSSFCQ
ncbi:MAG: hypothetical protein JXR96_16760 [Deltaproteobacteria bacterium]|nr:hypothetical protein [Deltaproteobacteria bacterium]